MTVSSPGAHPIAGSPPGAHPMAEDAVATGLAAFSVSDPEPDPAAEHEVRRRLLDVVGLAVASRDDDAVRAARSLARPAGDGGATIWGAPGRHDAHGAALANGVGARYRDVNDAYFARESLHPSDLVPALFAVAEELDRTVADLVAAVRRGYDVAVDLADTWRTASRGADHSNLILLGAVAGAGRLHGLDHQRFVEAFAIAAAAGISTRQVRRGDLTMWKGYAAASQAVAGVRAVEMARAGVRGPTLAFTGDQGFQAVAVDPATSIDAFEPTPAAQRGTRIVDTHLKVYPVGYLAQASVEVATDLHRQLAGRRPVAVEIHTYRRATEIMADPEKWRPASRETADHSLPYVTAAALLDGRLDESAFEAARREARDVRDLLEQVTVHADEEMTAAYPEQMPVRLVVTCRDGEPLEAEVRWPAGHARRPLPDEALVERSAARLGPTLGDGAATACARALLQAAPTTRVADLATAITPA